MRLTKGQIVETLIPIRAMRIKAPFDVTFTTIAEGTKLRIVNVDNEPCEFRDDYWVTYYFHSKHIDLSPLEALASIDEEEDRPDEVILGNDAD